MAPDAGSYIKISAETLWGYVRWSRLTQATVGGVVASIAYVVTAIPGVIGRVYETLYDSYGALVSSLVTAPISAVQTALEAAADTTVGALPGTPFAFVFAVAVAGVTLYLVSEVIDSV